MLVQHAAPPPSLTLPWRGPLLPLQEGRGSVLGWGAATNSGSLPSVFSLFHACWLLPFSPRLPFPLRPHPFPTPFLPTPSHLPSPRFCPRWLLGGPGEDLERNDGSKERPYFMSPELRDILLKGSAEEGGQTPEAE